MRRPSVKEGIVVQPFAIPLVAHKPALDFHTGTTGCRDCIRGGATRAVLLRLIAVAIITGTSTNTRTCTRTRTD